ncbi:MAG: hypothetical protein MRY32_03350 [Rickettsiales bacterium]|nr:hypothetical protein [Rickettsiales bacterium]
MSNPSDETQMLAEKLSWPALILGMAIGLAMFVSGFSIQQQFLQVGHEDIAFSYMAGAIIAALTARRVRVSMCHSLMAIFMLCFTCLYLFTEPAIYDLMPAHACVIIVPLLLGYVCFMAASGVVLLLHDAQYQQMIWAAFLLGAAIAIAAGSYVLLPMFSLHVILLILLQLMLLGWWLLRAYINRSIDDAKTIHSLKAFLCAVLIGSSIIYGVSVMAAPYGNLWMVYGLRLAASLLLLGLVLYVLRAPLSMISKYYVSSVLGFMAAVCLVSYLYQPPLAHHDRHIRARMIHSVFSEQFSGGEKVALWNALPEEYDLVAQYTGVRPVALSVDMEPCDVVMLMSSSSYDMPVVRWWNQENITQLYDLAAKDGRVILAATKPMLDRQMMTLLNTFERVEWLRESDGHYVLMGFDSNRDPVHRIREISDALKARRAEMGVRSTQEEIARWMDSRELPSSYRAAKLLSRLQPAMAFTFISDKAEAAEETK